MATPLNATRDSSSSDSTLRPHASPGAAAQTNREKEVNDKKRSRLEIARSTGIEAIKRKKAKGDIIAD